MLAQSTQSLEWSHFGLMAIGSEGNHILIPLQELKGVNLTSFQQAVIQLNQLCRDGRSVILIHV